MIVSCRGAGPLSPRPKAPQASVWGELAGSGRFPASNPVIDVVVPVYRGYDDTLACIHSILASGNTTAYELVIVNDCSPEPDLVVALEAIAAHGLIRLVRNRANQGFVRSATAAMARHPERDVILLNSDTIVYGNWIDRLRAHRLEKGKIGTITPWSNNATLLSYPLAFANNDVDLEIGFAELDRLAASELAGAACDIPTGVGFCIYINRECLDDIGTFNSQAFGRGYGEENDLCQRAAARGWRNIAACDVFVRHTGEVSFQQEAAEAKRSAAAALLKLHPSYMQLIASFMRADPLRPFRQTLDLARLNRWGGGKILLVLGDDPSDNLDRSIEEPASIAAQDRLRVVRICRSQDDKDALVVNPVADLILPNLPRLSIEDAAATARKLADMGVARVHIDSLLGYTPGQSRFVHELYEKLHR
jgi:GT2 family glycosyltransferase